MYSIKHMKGFAVLTTAVLLSFAGIVFTTNMAATQLIDNQVVANYYRNSEAFVNAESGINLILSQIDESDSILDSLPFTYQPAGSHYTVTLELVNSNTIEINSLGTSNDGSAQRSIQLQIYYEVSYDIPDSALASNGKLNLDSTATVNEGCEGVSAADCKSPGNIAEYQLVSHPKNETQKTECTGESLGENQIDQDALYTVNEDNNFLLIGEEKSSVDEFGDTVTEIVNWPSTIPSGSEFYGIATESNLSPSALFESTFGLTREAGIDALQASADIVTIDMTLGSAISCSKQLADVSDQESTIYIKGDCNIDQDDASQSVTSENKRLTIGSVESPKLVFIEGGTFITQPNTGLSVVGMLYFLPGTYIDVDENGNEVLLEEQSIDMGGVRVNGSTLSDYNCSYDGYDKTDNSGTKQHFSVRYDKTVLNTLYRDLGSVEVGYGYRIVDGSWRDF